MKREKKVGVSNKGFKYRIYPNKTQIKQIEGAIQAARYVRNLTIDLDRQIYSLGGKPNLSHFGLNKHITNYRKSAPFLNDHDSVIYMHEMKHLSKAWSDFFDNIKIYKQEIKKNPKTDMKRPTPPDFTKKNDRKQSFSLHLTGGSLLKHGIKEDGKLTLPKITGNIKVQYHRPIIGIPKKYTISKKHGKYYVSILVEYKNDVSKKEVKSVVGIDVGVKSLIVTSENEVIKNPKYLNQHLSHLSKLTSNRDKCVKYSNNWKKLNKKVQVLEEKISNCRKNYNHNVSKRLVDQYDLICMEDLDLVEMTESNKGTVENPGTNVKQKSNLNRNILDAGLGMLREMIIYKSVSSGKHTIKVDRYFPSSKKCNNCGTVNENLLLSQRVWECKNCKSEIDRDYNAALNIRDLGKKMFFENLEN